MKIYKFLKKNCYKIFLIKFSFKNEFVMESIFFHFQLDIQFFTLCEKIQINCNYFPFYKKYFCIIHAF